jgi:hypothetical protein
VETVWARDNPAATLLTELVVKSRGFLRPKTTVGETGDLGREVAQRPGFLGVLPLEEVGPGFKALRVDGIAASASSITRGAYPLARPVYLVRPGLKGRRATGGYGEGAAALAAYLERNGHWSDGAGQTLVLAGDLLLDGKPGEVIKAKGAGFPLAEVGPLLSQADLCLVNLECPLGETGWRINTYRGT